MTIVIGDSSMEKALAEAEGPVEVRNSAERTLGVFTPSRTAEDELYARAAELFDLEEIERRAALDEPTYTFDEVVASLASLDRSAG